MDIQQMMQQFQALVPGQIAIGGSAGGNLEALGELAKALQTSGYQTDVSQLTGGGAMTVQSLDTTMKATIQDNSHFEFFNRLATTGASNIVDEYVRQNSVGGIPGGSFNTEMGVVRDAQGDYSREIGLVKFLMTLRKVGFVLNIGKNIVAPIAQEESNGALQLLTDANYTCWNGHADSNPVAFDGFFAGLDKEIAAGKCPTDHAINWDGAKVDTPEAFINLAAVIGDYGSWGLPTDMYMPRSVQADLNKGLDPAFRWSSQAGTDLKLGGHVEGIRVDQGVIKTHVDTFMHHGDFPLCAPMQVNYAAAAVANAAFKPQAVTVATAALSTSKFTAPRAGNYYWGVAGIGPTGQLMSEVTLTAQTAVTTGEKATLSITASAGGTESGYAVYRSRQDGTNAAADLRLVGYVAKDASGTTTFVDANLVIPGTTRIALIDHSPASDAIGWRQYAPMTKIALPFGVGGQLVHSWFQLLMGYQRITKPKKHGYIANVLPSGATWKPHG